MSLRKSVVSAIFCFSAIAAFASPIKVEDLKPSKNLPKDRPSVALVLAGGGAKGFAELPIMEYIDQLDIPIDLIVGTSVGAIIGGFYSAGYSALEMINEFSSIDWTPYFTDEEVSPYESVYGKHGSDKNLLGLNFDDAFSLKLGTAVSNGQLAYQLFRKMLIKYPSNKSFDELQIPFRAVATDLLTGDAIVLQDGDLAEAIRASMSLPGVFAPMNIDDYYFTDGGIRYNLAINVAKAMGCDIVIAIDVSASVQNDPSAYESNPAVAMINALTIAESANTRPLYEMADLIITPDFLGYSALDFSKSKEIYEAGKADVEKYREPLENIRKKIYPKDYDKEGNRISNYKLPREKGNYHNRDYFIPSKLVCTNAVNKDIKYIYDAFAKISGKELTAANYDSFLNDLYLTGNYKSIHTRLMDTDELQYIDLQMIQRPKKEVKIFVNAELQQILSDTSTTRPNIDVDFQARGYTGIGSMFSVHATILTDYGFEIYYMQPFNPYLFVESCIGIFDEIYPVKANDIETFSKVTGFTKSYAELNFGLRTPNSNLAKLGISYNGIFPKYSSYVNDPFLSQIVLSNKIPNVSSSKRLYSQYLKAVFSTDFGSLDSKVFPTRGYNFAPTIKYILPFATEEYLGTYSPEFNFRLAIPLNKKVSLVTSFKMGMELSGNMQKYYQIIPYEAFTSFDRLYFPQITAKDHFGTNVFAAKTTFQFRPKERLTILGGEMLFRLEGTVGVINYDWADTFSQFQNPNTDYPILWSATWGFGLKANKSGNMLFRIGICSNYTSPFAFMMSVDVGNLWF